MGVEMDMTSIVRDIVDFLESLGSVDLPSKIEKARECLLQRTKTKLASLTVGRGGSTSPEPYLDMNAGKGLLARRKNQHAEIEEYVGVEEKSTGSQQDYYESFNESGRGIVDKIVNSMSLYRDDEVEDKLQQIYRSFTRAETIGKAIKFGNLALKIGRKSFLFGRDVRPCWIGLVGSHLIIYGNNDDRPWKICPINGYIARVAPNAMSKSAFEIVCPGNETLQFVATTAEEMEEWIVAINVREVDARIGEENLEEKNPDASDTVDIGVFSTNRKLEESAIATSTKMDLNNCNGTKASSSGCGKKNDSSGSLTHSPPALPVRLVPRRLPSLPDERILQKSPYEPVDDCYGEEDIYHKIEDFSYENLKDKSGNGVAKQGRPKKTSKRKKSKKDSKETREAQPARIIETYDDVQTIARDNENPSSREIDKSIDNAPSIKDECFLTYDDVAQASSAVRPESPNIDVFRQSKVDQSPVKSPSKKWFILAGVRIKKDSSKKEDKIRVEGRKNRKKPEKKEKVKSNADSAMVCEDIDLPTYYDDVSECINKQKVDDLSNYNCPPPPRPIYVKASAHINVPIAENDEEKKCEAIVEQVYDDISNYRDSGPAIFGDGNESGQMDLKNTIEAGNDVGSTGENRVAPETEHYQIPRKNGNHTNQCCVSSDRQVEQQLYDDIAILADFRTRQRDSVISAGEKPTISIKKPWSRFGSGKKIASRDAAAVDAITKNNPSSGDLEEARESHGVVASPEKHDAVKLNKLQKLYNKVESSLVKQPSNKSINSISSKTRKNE